MLGGYTGKVLFVDLGRQKIKEEVLDEKLYRSFIGGYGLGARILYSRQKGGVDALGPENILGMVTGPLTGSTRCWGSRYTVVAKSPLTGVWGDSNCGGEFGPYLKFAGFDAVFFSGISPKPMYLLCQDGKAEIRDATFLWGKDTYQTEELLKKELGDSFRLAAIGPSGEKKALIASVISERFRAAARAGLGAVMGAKNLKAVVAMGDRKIPLADSEALSRITKKYLHYIKTNPIGIDWAKFGTCGITAHAVLSGDAPVKNWAGAGPLDFPNYAGISDKSVVALQYVRHGCWHCPNPCGGLMEAGKQYKYPRGTYKPEYETLAAFGPMCLNDNLESIILANDICNLYGVDTMSAGALIAFAMECYENGAITKKDTDGIELAWGDHAAVIALLNKIVRREGIGDILADGVKVAARKMGRKAESHALHVHGQEPSYHDPRFNLNFAAAYVVDAEPGRHTQGGLGEPTGRMEGVKIPASVTDRNSIAGKGPYEAQLRNSIHITNCSGICLFGYWIMPREAVGDLISSVTGWKVSADELQTTGERIAAIRQAFTIREGVLPARDFKLPDRVIGKPPLTRGPIANRSVDVKAISDEYYKALGWDSETGAPTKKRLMELGLEDVDLGLK